MTDTPAQSRWQRWWGLRPRILKITVYPGRPAYIPIETWNAWEKAEVNPFKPYPEWVLAWGGKWRWRIRRDTVG
jgi:hypothetical protein